ncbi:MAG: radical SAM protein [Planctomycetes bacterium]|nr:radical SAM protein [Planctomycetota bacterium]
MESHVFGPVPSRRLGISLGVDVVPDRTCVFDCIYCQAGRTLTHTARRRAFFDTALILKQVRTALRKKRKLDYITFSGSGEPTLASNIGEVIRGIKMLTDTPVAVITNSSLMSRKTLQRDLLPADLLVPSLDAARQGTLRKINRPVEGIAVKDIIRGLIKFNEKFTGQMWLEIMLARGINDSPADVKALNKAIARIRPDRVQLNTVYRPPCEKYAKPIPDRAMGRIARQLAEGVPIEIIAPFKGKMDTHMVATREEVEALLKRRSCTIEDIAVSLGINKAEAIKHAEFLAATGKAQTLHHQSQLYYFVPS